MGETSNGCERARVDELRIGSAMVMCEERKGRSTRMLGNIAVIRQIRPVQQ